MNKFRDDSKDCIYIYVIGNNYIFNYIIQNRKENGSNQYIKSVEIYILHII